MDLLPFSAFAETGNGPESCISAPLFRGQRSIPVAQDAIPDFVREELDGISLDGIPETVEPPAGPGPDLTADALTQYRAIVGAGVGLRLRRGWLYRELPLRAGPDAGRFRHTGPAAGTGYHLRDQQCAGIPV